MKVTATIEDRDLGMADLMRRIKEGADHVDIGIHSDEDQTLITIAAANEFGAKINHPGGTAYGYATAADAKKKRIKFLKGGSGHKVLGRTRPHKIIIPMRSYIRSTVDENAESYHNMAQTLLKRVVDGSMTKHGALEIAGQRIEADIKRKMTTLRDPPNAPSTIRRKGSNNPLIDKGILRGSIRYVVGGNADGPKDKT